jgi:hypothetical protein
MLVQTGSGLWRDNNEARRTGRIGRMVCSQDIPQGSRRGHEHTLFQIGIIACIEFGSQQGIGRFGLHALGWTQTQA